MLPEYVLPVCKWQIIVLVKKSDGVFFPLALYDFCLYYCEFILAKIKPRTPQYFSISIAQTVRNVIGGLVKMRSALINNPYFVGNALRDFIFYVNS